MPHGLPIPSLGHRAARLVRLWVVVLCALSLVAVNVVHAYGHAEQALSSTTLQLDNGTPDSGNDVPDTSSAADHCHGCTLIGINVFATAAALHEAASVAIPLPLHGYIPAPASADTPPPKSTT